MTADLILGVDPGLKGALAFIDYLSGELVQWDDMPSWNVGGKPTVDEYSLARLLDHMGPRVVEAWIEVPTPRPGQGVTGPATSMRNYGLLRGLIIAQFIPLHEAPPATWKKAMGVLADKDDARAAASKFWPGWSRDWSGKSQDGRAEAALIAAYGRRKHGLKAVA